MVVSALFVEGSRIGPDSRNDQRECREAFKNLLVRCGFEGRLPRIFASGSRNNAYDNLCNALKDNSYPVFVAMLIDSEDPIPDMENTWEHLTKRDGWARPDGATDSQALLMTTSMETWILAGCTSIPASASLEKRDRKEVLDRLGKELPGYKKGKQSFRFLAQVDPEKLAPLPSFRRVRRILNEKLAR